MWFVDQDQEVKDHRAQKNLFGNQRCEWNSKLLRPHFEKICTANDDTIIAKFYDKIISNTEGWKNAGQVYKHVEANSKRFKVLSHLTKLTGCADTEEFQDKFKPIMGIHCIDAYEQYCSNQSKAVPSQVKDLASQMMKSLKAFEAR